jgi:hypothetical protein
VGAFPQVKSVLATGILEISHFWKQSTVTLARTAIGGIIRYPLPAHLQLLNNSNNKIIFIIPETSVAVYYRCVIIMDSIQVVLVVNNTFTAIQQLWFLK